MHFDEARRRFLYRSLTGVGGIALMDLLNGELGAASPVASNPLAPKQPHHEPKAKACIFLLMDGGPSHIDTFDPKPKLNQYDGQTIPEEFVKGERFAFIRGTPRLLGSPYLLWAVWVASKTLLAWGALAYLGSLVLRQSGRDWLRWRWRDLTQGWAFRRDQRQLLREYQHEYLAAKKQGRPLPPRPPELVSDAAMSSFGGGAQAAYWLLRIGYFLVGGTLFWWAFGDYLALIAHRLAGPTPWWWGLGR